MWPVRGLHAIMADAQQADEPRAFAMRRGQVGCSSRIRLRDVLPKPRYGLHIAAIRAIIITADVRC